MSHVPTSSLISGGPNLSGWRISKTLWRDRSPSVSENAPNDTSPGILETTNVAYELDRRHYVERLETFREENQRVLRGGGADSQIVLLGDSLVEQFDLKSFFPQLPIFNRGIAEDRFDHEEGFSVIHRLTPELLAPNPAIIIIQLGFHDLAIGTSVPIVIARMSTLLDQLQTQWPRVRIVAQSVVPTRSQVTHVTSNIADFNRQLQTLSKSNQLDYIDVYSAFVGPEGKLRRRFSLDGLRLSPKAYAIWAKQLARTYGWSLPRRTNPFNYPSNEPKSKDDSPPRLRAIRTLPDPKTPLEFHTEIPVHQLFRNQATRTPSRLAIVDSLGNSISYEQLLIASIELSRNLTRQGVRHGDVVAVWSARSSYFPQALLGILGAGAAFAILDPSYPATRLAQSVTIARPKAIVTIPGAGPIPDELSSTLNRIDCHIRVLVENAHWTSGDARTADFADVNATDLAYIAFTSGTTGAPRGIAGTHAPLSHFLRWHVRTFGFSDDDRFTMLSGLAHDPLLRDIFTPLICGATLTIPSPQIFRKPDALRAFLNEEEVTVLHATPSLVALLEHNNEYDVAYRTLRTLRWVFFGGESLKRTTIERFKRFAPSATCVNFYGATETPQAMGYYLVCPNELQRSESNNVCIGRGIADVQLLVFGENDRLAEIGETGEVCIRTPYLAVGYLGEDALTHSRFVTNPYRTSPEDRIYRTGDLGRYSSSGVVEILGRADRQVKVRGYRVELDDVESTLAMHPEIEQVAVALENDDDPCGAQIVAFVASPTRLEELQLRQFLSSRLPDYMVPARFHFLRALPITANGKVDRRALSALNVQHLSCDEPTDAAPDSVNYIEYRLLQIWKQVLHAPNVRRDSSFFELGGDSLRALELLQRIEQEFGKRLPINSLLLSSSIAQLAPILRSNAPEVPFSSLVVIREGSNTPPVYWLPGGGGLSVMAFREISHRLGPDIPVLGLEANLDINHAPTKLPDIVRAYAKEICLHQPEGPYFLFGFSLGSFVAYELALQLSAAGKSIGLLVVFDTPLPSSISTGKRALITLARSRYRLRSFFSEGTVQFQNIASYPISVANLVTARLTRKFQKPASPTIFDIIVQRNIDAIREYAARPLPFYNGHITCVLASDTSMHGVPQSIDPRLAWRNTCAGINVIHVDGNHLSMLEPPCVDSLGKALRTCLRDARRKNSIDAKESSGT